MGERMAACYESRHTAFFRRSEFANLEGQQEAVVDSQAVLDLALVLEPEVRRHLHPVGITGRNVNEQHATAGQTLGIRAGLLLYKWKGLRVPSLSRPAWWRATDSCR